MLGAGRCLLTLGRPEGRLRLQEARSALATLDAKPLLAEAEAALDGTAQVRAARWGGSGAG